MAKNEQKLDDQKHDAIGARLSSRNTTMMICPRTDQREPRKFLLTRYYGRVEKIYWDVDVMSSTLALITLSLSLSLDREIQRILPTFVFISVISSSSFVRT